jgi:hypothetical protein
MARGGVFSKVNDIQNKLMVPLMTSPRGRKIFDRYITVISYTGRRSGDRFSTPVFYRRKGDTVTIRVALPDKKNWWRNFEGEGGPITLDLRGTQRTGRGTAVRDQRGRTTVTVALGS